MIGRLPLQLFLRTAASSVRTRPLIVARWLGPHHTSVVRSFASPASEPTGSDEKLSSSSSSSSSASSSVLYESKRSRLLRFIGVGALSQFAAGVIAAPMVLMVGRTSSVAAANALAPRIVLSVLLVGGGFLLVGVVRQLLKRYVVSMELVSPERVRITTLTFFGRESHEVSISDIVADKQARDAFEKREPVILFEVRGLRNMILDMAMAKDGVSAAGRLHDVLFHTLVQAEQRDSARLR